MTQLGNTDSTCKVRWKMWLFKVFVVTYLTAVCAAQDVPDATFVPTAATALQEVITTAYVPPVPVLQQTSGWLEIFPSEKVKFSWTISGSSDWTFTWYRNGDKIDADANFSFPGDGSVLTITAATNSGKYTCKGQHKTKSVMTQSSNSLELKVHANRPKLSRSSNYQEMFPGESITFTCLVDMSVGWEYLWYHNGTEIPAADRNMYTIEPAAHSDNGQYHCKAKRGKDRFYAEDSEPTHLRVSGVLLCKTVPFVQTTAIVTGILTMTCIATERYQGIVFPLKMRRQYSSQRAFKMLGPDLLGSVQMS